MQRIQFAFLLSLFALIILIHRRSFNRTPPLTFSDIRPRIQSKPFYPPTMLFTSHSYPELPEFARIAIQSYTAYCERNGIAYRDYTTPPNKTRVPPIWHRVMKLNKLCETQPSGVVIMYADVDTMIKPQHLHININDVIDQIDAVTGKRWDMYVGQDPGGAGLYRLNSGVLIVRNTAWTRSFLKRWLNMYDAVKWSQDSAYNWICDGSNNYHESGKYCYTEQGALNQLWHHEVLNASRHIYLAHKSFFSDTDYLSQSFMVHAMGVSNEFRAAWFKRMIRREFI